jgi:hypothetical protein
MYFDKGWQISFRIHNASTMVEPSLKFDINIVGLPSNLSRQVINNVYKSQKYGIVCPGAFSLHQRN